MWVFGDRERVVDPRAVVAGVAGRLADVAARPAGVDRHAALVAAFVEAGELAQGVADDAFVRGGRDARDPAADVCLRLVMAIARMVARSWRGDGALSAPIAEVGAVAAAALPARVRVRTAEGHAFYALYPEAYLEAAAALAGEPVRVIGIRSIGAGLAALVAVATGAPLPITVRPVGPPFARELRVAPALLAEVLDDPRARIAIVDEGPGLSGSSFGAVADLLEGHGVAPGRLRFFPGHRGALGPQAAPAHRARWDRAARHVVDIDALLIDSGVLARWVAGVVGPLAPPWRDVGGGRWRALRYRDEDAWPPADVTRERRKFLARAGGATWLVKFAGLGAGGERALDRARRLHAAGFGAEPAGLCHGFLVERWCDGAPLDLAGDRASLVDTVGRYLAFRARELPAAGEPGADPDALRAMARRNVGLALGEPAVAALDRRLPAVGAGAWPIETDNRLHAWEWLVAAGGALIKTDALDHHAGHDLIGCQDVAWDVVGAELELGLDAAELARVIAIVERDGGRPIDPARRAFLRPCYLAFQLGAFTLAADGGGAPAEVARLRGAAAGYARRLRAELAA